MDLYLLNNEYVELAYVLRMNCGLPAKLDYVLMLSYEELDVEADYINIEGIWK